MFIHLLLCSDETPLTPSLYLFFFPSFYRFYPTFLLPLLLFVAFDFSRLFPSLLSLICPLHLPPHVVLLSISFFAPPTSLSSLAHIWFLSLDLCVFGVMWSSLGLPAHTQTVVAYGLACQGLFLHACLSVLRRVQQVSSWLCNTVNSGSFRRR